MTIRSAALALILASLPLGAAVAAPPAKPVRVKLTTSIGPIVIELDMKHAPISSANFLAYVDQKRFNQTNFYRAARAGHGTKDGFIEGGIHQSIQRTLKPIPHEPTTKTGLHHVDGTVSMARDAPGTATGDFFIVVGPGQYLDATKKDPGYAAFGHVVSGMPLVKRILAAPTFSGGFSAETKGQTIKEPFKIVTVERMP